MPAAGIAALVVTAVLVAALAFFLIWVVLVLRRLTDTLDEVGIAVAAIADRVEPVGGLVSEINGDLTAVADTLEALAADLDPARAARASQEPAMAVTKVRATSG